MKRILIIGVPGAGKTTLARRLGKLFNLPVIHLDRQFWQPGWKKMDTDLWRDRQKQLVAGEKWIIDGNYDATLDMRLPHCDTIIHLDFPRWLCMWRVIWRIIKGYGKVRTDMAPGCPEHIDFEFFRFVWNFRRNEHIRILEQLKKYSSKNIIHVTNTREVATLISDFERQIFSNYSAH